MPPSKPVNLQNRASARSLANRDSWSQWGQFSQLSLQRRHFTT